MSEKATLSFHQDSHFNEQHDNRTIYVPYVDTERSKDNYYAPENISQAEAYHLLFDDAQRAYNSAQTRADRRIGDYHTKILTSAEENEKKVKEAKKERAPKKRIAQLEKHTKPAYQIIISIGNVNDNPDFSSKNGSRKYEIRELMKRYIDDFRKRNSNMYLYNAAIHLDEGKDFEKGGVVHCHLSFIPYADGFKKGMSRQVSLNRALEAQGFVSDSEQSEEGYELAITKWQNSERAVLEELCKEHGIEIIDGEHSEKHLSRREYIIQRENERQAENAEVIENNAKIVVNARKDIQRFLNSEQGNVYLMSKENADMKQKLNRQKRAVEIYWDEYKESNAAYWKNYQEKKQMLRSSLHRACSDAAYNRSLLNQQIYDLFGYNEAFIIRLLKIIIILALMLHNRELERQIRELQQINSDIKNEAHNVLQESVRTAKTLKTGGVELIEQQMRQWEESVKTVCENVQAEYERTHYREQGLDRGIER